jgi:hypothetical protein
MVEALQNLVLQAKAADHGLRQTVGQSKGDELDGFRRVEVRQITAGVPSF